ncbi:MAG TPA: NlpC/P60 family protein [Candidatus Limnocylindrales bacterium]|nr:NlpC/P60 family protein [Candidatus Limnocylindrales bacterium]
MQVLPGLRAIGVAALAGVALVSIQSPPPVAASTPADRVISIAQAHLGDPWRYGAEGPSAFDCSGLVIYSFEKAGYGSKVANGRYRSAYALYSWYRGRGLASRTGGQRGDLVVWGGGSHVGIYLGDGKAISTLTSGVRIHGVYAVTAPFTAFLHTHMSGATTVTFTSYRYTTEALRLRAGPSTSYSTYAILDRNTKLGIRSSKLDSADRRWYWVYSFDARRGGWVAGWYTRAV